MDCRLVWVACNLEHIEQAPVRGPKTFNATSLRAVRACARNRENYKSACGLLIEAKAKQVIGAKKGSSNLPSRPVLMQALCLGSVPEQIVEPSIVC